MIKPIQGQRLFLREIRTSDGPFIHEYASDPFTTRFMEWGPNTPKDTREFVKQVLNEQKEKPRRNFTFGIIRVSDRAFLGTCAIETDRHEGCRTVGYILNKRHWGQGYMTEALTLLFQFGFKTRRYKRLHARVDTLNKASQRVLAKMGFKITATLKNHQFFKGRWHSSYALELKHPQVPV